jgi:hypothetical protein
VNALNKYAGEKGLGPHYLMAALSQAEQALLESNAAALLASAPAPDVRLPEKRAEFIVDGKPIQVDIPDLREQPAPLVGARAAFKAWWDIAKKALYGRVSDEELAESAWQAAEQAAMERAAQPVTFSEIEHPQDLSLSEQCCDMCGISFFFLESKDGDCSTQEVTFCPGCGGCRALARETPAKENPNE